MEVVEVEVVVAEAAVSDSRFRVVNIIVIIIIIIIVSARARGLVVLGGLAHLDFVPRYIIVVEPDRLRGASGHEGRALECPGGDGGSGV